MEKLDIIIRLVPERNIEQVLLEFKEYATEVDVEFVRRSTKVNYIVQEAIIVIKDISASIQTSKRALLLPYARTGYIGRARVEGIDDLEYRRVCRAYRQRDELLESLMDSFDDETAQVQLQLICRIRSSASTLTSH
ncbi:unnamed protein product [Peronospora effusa]|nr:unnamed protein product [Peronospora effusa]